MSTIDRIGTVRIGVWSKEHCPPHATAKDRREWTMRIEFSFAEGRGHVDLLDIVHSRSTPSAPIVNNVIDTIRQNLRAYRTAWWNYQSNNPVNSQQGGPCCLNNKTLSSGEQVLSATYNPASDEVTTRYRDGTTVTKRAPY